MANVDDRVCSQCGSPLMSGFSVGVCDSCCYRHRKVSEAVCTVRSYYPQLLKPEPRTEWEKAHARMTELMTARLEAGRELFGDKWLEKLDSRHLEDMIEELVDFSNYAAFMVYKLERIRDALERKQEAPGDDTESPGVAGTHCA